ncbi:unnamed protein product [Protopolystoma xenopodis]|uniref:Uncharacterized protein n=1 Tax=Protopolystoma xenopodis TaxID=117903 RepID=A0A448WRJ0_9PLAT|nr:unnamed protein product [Protopolystoma xenopodis]
MEERSNLGGYKNGASASEDSESLPPEMAYREACRRKADHLARSKINSVVVGRRGGGVDVEAIMVRTFGILYIIISPFDYHLQLSML